MTQAISRRGLFRALRASGPDDGSFAKVSTLAKVGVACVEPKGVTCRRCSEACDVHAIRFRLLGGGRAMASISSEACTGCGECIAVCPVNAIELVSRERAALVAGLMGQSTGAPS